MGNRASNWLAIVLAAVIGFAAWTPAHAISGFTPPERRILDPNGVDLATSSWYKVETFLTIGDPAHGGLQWSSGRIQDMDSYTGLLSFHSHGLEYEGGFTPVLTASFGEASTTFLACDGPSVTCYSSADNYAKMVHSGSTWVMTAKDGTTYTYDELFVNTAYTKYAKPVSVQKPDGTTVTINYNSCVSPLDCKIRSVVSSAGYGFRYDYNTGGQLIKIWAVNMAYHVCDTAVLTCDGYDNYITFSTTSGAITDSLGNTTILSADLCGPDGNKQCTSLYQTPSGAQITAVHDYYGRIESLTNSTGTWTYVHEDLDPEDFDHKGTHKTFAYDPSGAIFMTTTATWMDARIVWKKDGLGRQTTYQYTGFTIPGHPNTSPATPRKSVISGITFPEGNRTTFGYDTRGNVNLVTNIAKSGSGLSNTTISAVYPTTCTNFKTCNQPTSTTDARGFTTTYTYDANSGGLASETSPTVAAPGGGTTTRKTVNTYTQLPSYRYGGGTTFLPLGNIYKLTESSICSTATTCDGTVNQLKTVYGYVNANLLPMTVTQKTGNASGTTGYLETTTTTSYDYVSNPSQFDGPRTDVNDMSYTTYDAARRKVFEIGVDPDGAGSLKRPMTKHIYDVDGKEIRTEIGSGNTTNGSDFAVSYFKRMTYDVTGRLIKTEMVQGTTVHTVTQVSYDVRNQLVCTAVRMNPATFASLPSDPCTAATESTTYGPDRISKTLYDNAGQVTQTIQAFGTSVQRAYATYAYSNNGKPTDSIDANGNRTKLIYDGFDRLKYYHYPSTTRPSAWNPSTQTTALSTAGAYSTTDYEQYGYDNNGNKISVRRRDGNSIGYTFDALNRETLKDIPGGTTKDVYTAYDLTGHIWSKRFNSASNTTGVFYYYDGLGRLESTTDTNSRTVWYQYNQAGSRTRLTYYDGNWQPYNLDAANRLTSTGIGIANLTLSYNDLGQMTTISRNNSTSTSYGYDAIGRVSSMGQDFSSAGHDVSWTFARNPSSQVRELTATNDADYTYDETATTTIGKSYDGLNRDATIAALSGGYDLRGNLTSEGSGGRTFTYDIENRLLTATGGTVALTLDYDPEGRLSSYTAGATTRTFLYDGVNLIGEYLGTTMDRRYLHGTGTDQPVIEFLDANIGAASSIRHLYSNYQGSVIARANTAGVRVDVYKYDPYGKPTNSGNVETWTNIEPWIGTRFRYTGQIIIPEAKLYYYKARVYDPIAGRFLQTDPIGDKSDLNLYSYVTGDPINKNDPTGLDAVVLNDTFAGSDELGMDHQGILIGNDKSGWTYLSKEGAIGENKFAGPSAYTAIRFHGNLSEVLKIDKYFARYDDAYRTSTTDQEDAAMSNAGLKELARGYNFLTQNCGDVVGKALSKIGVNFNSINPQATKKQMRNRETNGRSWRPVVFPTEGDGRRLQSYATCLGSPKECTKFSDDRNLLWGKE